MLDWKAECHRGAVMSKRRLILSGEALTVLASANEVLFSSNLSQQRCPTLQLEGESYHYIARVLRLRAGDELEVSDGRGGLWDARITSINKEQVELELLESLTGLALPFPLYLAQSMQKGDKFDRVLRQATELGVTGFFPFFSERSIVHFDEGRQEHRMQRWQKIMQEASRQSQRTRVPELLAPVDFSELPDILPPGCLRLLLWEEAQGLTLKQWLQQHTAPAGVVVVVGPEGGFSPEEAAFALSRQIEPVGLGPQPKGWML